MDVGSTYTKGAAVHAETGALLAVATHPTTLTPDVLVGLDAVRADLAAQVEQLVVDEVLVCSSAGGGLRLAVVGYERAVTAEAGYLVGLSAGARVVHVAAGRLDVAGVAALVDSRPDVVLLVGGTDGGDTEVVVHNGDRIARSHLRCPVVVAGNAEVTSSVATALTVRGKHVLSTVNVLPSIGVLDAAPARAMIREVFIRHVIGGKRLSRGAQFASLVRAATPDAVLAGVEVLADGAGGTPGAGDILVVDVGGATSDV
ncbi:MAG: glutamate mutase L, partial [Actinomycetota bacterium]|nr:glutamate mutase L [Actinomycetota bacterium]